jgi:hypothetical protein
MMAGVDRLLLLLFARLFGVSRALNGSGVTAQLIELLTEHGLLLPDSFVLLTRYAVLASNTIGGALTCGKARLCRARPASGRAPEFFRSALLSLSLAIMQTLASPPERQTRAF